MLSASYFEHAKAICCKGLPYACVLADFISSRVCGAYHDCCWIRPHVCSYLDRHSVSSCVCACWLTLFQTENEEHTMTAAWAGHMCAALIDGLFLPMCACVLVVTRAWAEVALKRMLLDQTCFAPGFIVVVFSALNTLEGRCASSFQCSGLKCESYSYLWLSLSSQRSTLWREGVIPRCNAQDWSAKVTLTCAQCESRTSFQSTGNLMWDLLIPVHAVNFVIQKFAILAQIYSNLCIQNFAIQFRALEICEFRSSWCVPEFYFQSRALKSNCKICVQLCIRVPLGQSWFSPEMSCPLSSTEDVTGQATLFRVMHRS